MTKGYKFHRTKNDFWEYLHLKSGKETLGYAVRRRCLKSNYHKDFHISKHRINGEDHWRCYLYGDNLMSYDDGSEKANSIGSEKHARNAKLLLLKSLPLKVFFSVHNS